MVKGTVTTGDYVGYGSNCIPTDFPDGQEVYVIPTDKVISDQSYAGDDGKMRRVLVVEE